MGVSGLALVALLALLQAVAADAGTLLLFKAHSPTEAMLARFCLAAKQSRKAAFPTDFVLLDYSQPNGTSLLPDPASGWCDEPPETVRITTADLEELFGKFWRTYYREGYKLASLPELAFHAKFGAQRKYTAMWVFEQDVGWTGNLFDFFPAYATTYADFMCDKVVRWETPAADWAARGTPGLPAWKPPRHWNFPWWDFHSGMMAETPKRTVCGVYVARYSLRLLDHLLRRYLYAGGWAHCEMFASSVCDLQMDLPASWKGNCKVANLRNDAQFRNPHAFFGANFRVGMPGVNGGPGGLSAFAAHRIALDKADFESHFANASLVGAPVLYHPLKF
jgi:hypothetical protein